jgi:hypothetical protein
MRVLPMVTTVSLYLRPSPWLENGECKTQLICVELTVFFFFFSFFSPNNKKKMLLDLADYRLRIANERLREENMQLQEQVREYERWMEYIMGKFRLQNVKYRPSSSALFPILIVLYDIYFFHEGY